MSRDSFGDGLPAGSTEDGRVVGGLERAPEELAEDIGARIRIVDVRTGQTGTVAARDIDRALESGRFRLATDEEHRAVRERRRREQLGDDAFSTAATVVREAADAFTAGGVRDIDAAQGDVAAAHAEALREENPGAALLGTLAGGVAQGALIGGAGSLITGGRALTAGGRAALAAAEGATEGAAMGLTDLSRERVITGGPITAEALLEHVGGGALLGLGGGLAADGLLGLARGAGRLRRAPGATVADDASAVGRRLAGPPVLSPQSQDTRRAVERVAERALGGVRPEPTVVDELLQRVARTSTAGLPDDVAESVSLGLSRTAEGRAFREAISGSADVDGIARRLREQIDDLGQIAERAGDFAKGELKRGQVRRLMTGQADQQLDSILDDGGALFEQTRRLADALEADRALVGSSRRAKELRTIADQFQEELTTALSRGGRDGAADAFIALDRAKRRIGRLTATAHRSRTGLQEYADHLDDVYHRFRDHLEDRTLYGRAADAQREINSVWSELIPASRKFDRAFRTDAGMQEGFHTLRTADPAKLHSYLQQTGTARADLLDETLERTVELQQKFADIVAKHYELPEDVAAAARAMRETAGSIKSTIGDVRQQVRARNQWKEITSALAERDGALGGLGSVGGFGVAGALVGGPLGALAGAGIGMLRRPDRMVRTLAALESVVGSLETRISKGVSGLIKSSSKGARRGARSGARRASSGRGARAARRIAERSVRSTAARFDAVVERIRAWQADPDAERERIAELTRQIAEAAPETSVHIAEAAARAAGYLAATMPPGATPPPSLLRDDRRPSERVSHTEMHAFMRRVDVVDDPLSALDEAAAGTLTSEHVEALRTVYPSIHAELVQRTVEELADLEEPPPYERRVAISLLLDVPTDPTMAGEYIARSQVSYAGAQDEPVDRVVTPGRATPPEVSGMMQSRATQLAHRSEVT